MIHVLTVHWLSDRWISVQAKYLAKYLRGHYRIYAFIDAGSSQHQHTFFWSSTEPIRAHAEKLNLLAEVALRNAASPDDWLLFIDGDAFPIADVVPLGERLLAEYPLAAVQRRENLGDIQPHPCFCLTTVRFWQDLKGDWREGYSWRNESGQKVTDIGGNLLGLLESHRIRWAPLLRSNRHNLHPVFFGIYENIVYHHGAGFRSAICREDVMRAAPSRSAQLLRSAFGPAYRRLPKSWRAAVRRMLGMPPPPTFETIAAPNEVLSKKIYQQILTNMDFFRQFVD